LIAATVLAAAGLAGRPVTVAAAVPPGFTETLLVSSLSQATAMAFAPDGRIFILQQGGVVRVFKNGALLPTPFLTLAVDSAGERGLLGIAFDPDFSVNQRVYFYYTVPGSGGAAPHNRISRFTASGDVASPGSEVVLLDLEDLSGATNHNGGAIHFGLDGMLYVGVGENANASNAQSLTTRLGKILRLTSDGSPAPGNPTSFPGVAGSTSGVYRAIWAIGLRNPFTMAVQPAGGRIFLNDVGQNTFEEINDGVGGSNYGWPATEGPTTNPNFRSPLSTYDHTTGPRVAGNPATDDGVPFGCAIAGGAFYNPPTQMFPASYVGDYFFGDFCGGWLRSLDVATGVSTAFGSSFGAVVDVRVGADGALYVLSRTSLRRISAEAPDAPRGAFDFNGDGLGDALTHRPDGAWALRYATASGFQTVTGNWPANRQVHAGDFNGDGLTDALLYDPVAGAYSVAIKTGDSFTLTHGMWSPNWTITILDLNGDPRSDPFFYNAVTGVWISGLTAAGGVSFVFEAGQWSPGWRLSPSELNGDAFDDLFLYNASTGRWFWAASNGAGDFSYPRSGLWSPGWQETIADFNGDDRSDVFVYNVTSGLWVLCTNTGAGFVYASGLWSPAWRIAAGDLDGNGRDDLFLYNDGSGAWFRALTTNDASVFSYKLGQWSAGWQLQTTDLNNDGRTDVIVYNAATGDYFECLSTASNDFTYLAGDWEAGMTVVASRPLTP
jgi:glucose/arabinose dehydrogenase